LPAKITADMGRDNIMVFHTATTNSNNCSGKNDIKNISDAVKDSIKK
jgi:Predicted membrane protein